MQKTKKLIILILVVGFILSTLPGYSLASPRYKTDNLTLNFSAINSSFQNLSQAKQRLDLTSSALINTKMNLKLTYPNEEFVLGQEIVLNADLKWSNSRKPIKSSLTGDATVYSDNENTVLFCSLFGYCGEECDDNFITLSLTYDIKSKISKASLTIGTDNGSNKKPILFEFGQDSPAFKPAYKYLEKNMVRNIEQISPLNEIKPQLVAATSYDSTLYARKTFAQSYGGYLVHSFTLYSQKNFMESGVFDIFGKSGCNTQNAESYIVGNINNTAWAVEPRKLEIVLRARASGVQIFGNNEDPVNSETNFSISIPLPLEQSVDLSVVLSSTQFSKSATSGYAGSYHVAKWNFTDISEITELNSAASNLSVSNWPTTDAGVACNIKMYHAGSNISSDTTRKIDGYSKISFHYLYFDSNMNMANTYWTTSVTIPTQDVTEIAQ